MSIHVEWAISVLFASNKDFLENDGAHERVNNPRSHSIKYVKQQGSLHGHNEAYIARPLGGAIPFVAENQTPAPGNCNRNTHYM